MFTPGAPLNESKHWQLSPFNISFQKKRCLRTVGQAKIHICNIDEKPGTYTTKIREVYNNNEMAYQVF